MRNGLYCAICGPIFSFVAGTAHRSHLPLVPRRALKFGPKARLAHPHDNFRDVEYDLYAQWQAKGEGTEWDWVRAARRRLRGSRRRRGVKAVSHRPEVDYWSKAASWAMPLGGMSERRQFASAAFAPAKASASLSSHSIDTAPS